MLLRHPSCRSLHHREGILHAMVEFVDQQPFVLVGLLALGNIHIDADHTNELAVSPEAEPGDSFKYAVRTISPAIAALYLDARLA